MRVRVSSLATHVDMHGGLLLESGPPGARERGGDAS